jgi:hypothetical protein
MPRVSYRNKKKLKTASIKRGHNGSKYAYSYRKITDDEASDKLFALYRHIEECKRAFDVFKAKALREGKTESIVTTEACHYFSSIVLTKQEFVSSDILPVIDMHIRVRHNNAEKWHKINHFRNKLVINKQIAEIYSILNMTPFNMGYDVSAHEARCKLFALYAARFPFPPLKQNQDIIDKNKSIINLVREWAESSQHEIIWEKLPLHVDDQELNDKIAALYSYIFHSKDAKKERGIEGEFLDYIRSKNEMRMAHVDWNTMKSSIKWNDI